jgi:hypothetical protein
LVESGRVGLSNGAVQRVRSFHFIDKSVVQPLYRTTPTPTRKKDNTTQMRRGGEGRRESGESPSSPREFCGETREEERTEKAEKKREEMKDEEKEE